MITKDVTVKLGLYCVLTARKLISYIHLWLKTIGYNILSLRDCIECKNLFLFFIAERFKVKAYPFLCHYEVSIKRNEGGKAYY